MFRPRQCEDNRKTFILRCGLGLSIQSCQFFCLFVCFCPTELCLVSGVLGIWLNPFFPLPIKCSPCRWLRLNPEAWWIHPPMLSGWEGLLSSTLCSQNIPFAYCSQTVRWVHGTWFQNASCSSRCLRHGCRAGFSSDSVPYFKAIFVQLTPSSSTRLYISAKCSWRTFAVKQEFWLAFPTYPTRVLSDIFRFYKA